MTNNPQNMMSFGGHMEVLRQILFRILIVVGVFSVVIFIYKSITFDIILSPSDDDFITYKWIERLLSCIGFNYKFDEFQVNLIATDLSSQFMTHISTSCYLGGLAASPYILYKVFQYISPALYENEKRYSIPFLLVSYILFLLGLLMSYFVIFPISFRFLGTYSVADKVVSNITLDSYISTFMTLSVVMGLVFQLPVISFLLAKLNFIKKESMVKYRKHAFIVILVIAAVITPPDLMTLILVSLPLCILYELSIHIVSFVYVSPKNYGLTV